MKRKIKIETLVEDDSFTLHKSKGNGILRRQIWCDSNKKVTRYSLAYINRFYFSGDNGRVLGYDNAHGYHHKHFFGKVEPVNFSSFSEIERQFKAEFEAIHEKLRKNKAIVLSVKTESMQDFFSRGKEKAKLLDQGKSFSPERIISFEDPKDLIKFITEARLILLSTIRNKPDSISGLARKLHRSRSAIDKDVQLLESVGIVESQYITNPGHGRYRIIKTIDNKPIKLMVETLI